MVMFTFACLRVCSTCLLVFVISLFLSKKVLSRKISTDSSLRRKKYQNICGTLRCSAKAV